MKICLKKRNRYIELVKRMKITQLQAANDQSADLSDDIPMPFHAENDIYHRNITKEETEEMLKIEEMIPVDTLMLFRHIAIQEVYALRRKHIAQGLGGLGLSQALVDSGTNQRTWGEWWFGEGASSEADENGANRPRSGCKFEDESIQELQSKLMEAFEEDFRSTSYILKLNVGCGVILSLALLDNSQKLVTSSTHVTVGAHLYSDSKNFAISVNDAAILDQYTTPAPVIKHILLWSNDEHLANEASFIVSYEKKKGTKHNVSIKAASIELCVNSQCMEQLLKYFIVSNQEFDSIVKFPRANHGKIADTHASIKRLRTKLKAHQSIAAGGSKSSNTNNSSGVDEVDVSTSHDVEINIEAASPKIIIPESSNQDEGYLLLDTGKISVSMNMSAAGKFCRFNISNIRAGLPVSVENFSRNVLTASREMNVNTDMYVIKPFDVVGTFQNVDQVEAAAVLKIEILPEIRGEFDCVEMNRVLDCLSVVSSTMAATSPETVEMASATIVDLSENLLGAVKKSSRTKEVDAKEQKLLAEYKNMLISVNIPEVALQLNYSAPVMFTTISIQEGVSSLTYPKSPKDGSYQMLFSLYPLQCEVVSRAYDTIVSVHLDNVTIQDSMRSGKQHFFAEASGELDEMEHQVAAASPSKYDSNTDSRVKSKSPEGKAKHLVSVSYISMNSALSPCYKHHASEIVVEIAKIHFNVDVKSILHLRPFIEVFLRRNVVAALEAKKQRINATAVDQCTESTLLPITEPKMLQGMHMTLTLDQISIDCYREPSIEEEKRIFFHRCTLASSSHYAPTWSRNGSHEKKKVQVGDSLAPELELAFSLYVTDWRADVKFKQFAHAVADLKSITMVDQRRESQDFIVKTIFCPQSSIKAFNKDLKSCGHVGGLGGSAESKTDVGDRGSRCTPDPDILHVEFTQFANNITSFDVLIEGLACYVTIDTILDLTNILVASTYSILDLVVAPHVYIPNIPSSDHSNSNRNLQALDENMLTNKENKKNSTIKVSVSIPNPRLILLDDPSTTHESEALVGLCSSIDISYGRAYYNGFDAKNNETLEIRESVLIGVKKQEMFVLLNIEEWVPQQILEPLDFHCHIRRTIDNNVVPFMDLTFDLDNINLRLSIKDLLLAQSILLQATGNKAKRAAAVDVPSSLVVPQAMSKQVTVLNISVTIGSIDTILINDFAGQNIPYLRCGINGATLEMNGPSAALCGNCSFFVTSDFFNPNTFIWEPFVEKCMPAIKLASDMETVKVDFSIDKTLQISTSGVMLESLLHTYSLLLGIEDEEGGKSKKRKKREIIPDYLIKNYLGSNLDLLISDPISGKKMFVVSADPHNGCSIVSSEESIEELEGVTKRHRGRVDNVAELYVYNARISGSDSKIKGKMLGQEQKSVNAHVLGIFEGQRLPLTRLPLVAMHKTTYYLQPAAGTSNSISHYSTVAKPFIEEVFENQRFDPVMRVWRKPFLSGDAYEFSDINGITERTKENIHLPQPGKDQRSFNLEWEWQHDWEVDISSFANVLSADDDPNMLRSSREKTAASASLSKDEGWVYAPSFNTLSSMHRVKRAVDMVRRRRWIRARAPKALKLHDPIRPLTVVWDVIPQQNGSSVVEIRSTLQVRNLLPYPVCISLHNSAWDSDVEFLNIASLETFNVPLLYAYASKIKMKPADSLFSGYDYSEYVSCNIHSQEYYKSRVMCCLSSQNSATSATQIPPISCKSLLVQENGSLMVSFMPHVRILNTLFSNLEYKCCIGDESVEVGVIEPANNAVFCYASTDDPRMKFAFKVGDFEWSDMLPFAIEYCEDVKYGSVCNVDGSCERLVPFRQGDKVSLVLVVKYKHCRAHVNESGALEYSHTSRRQLYDTVLEIEIFSRGAVIDRTGLGVWLKSRWDDKDSQVIRSTAMSSGSSHFSIKQVQLENTFDTYISPRKLSFVNSFIDSDLKYVIEQNSIGGYVYSDEHIKTDERSHGSTGWKWSYLPPYMRNAMFIRTASRDRQRRIKNLIKFTITDNPIVVIVLVDVSFGKTEPSWLHSTPEHGFQLLSDVAIAQRKVSSNMHGTGNRLGEEMCFKMYGRMFAVHEEVELSGNWSKYCGNMYSVCVVSIVEHQSDTASVVNGGGGAPSSVMNTNSNIALRPSRPSNAGNTIELGDGTMLFSNKAANSLLDSVLFPIAYSLTDEGVSWDVGNNGMSYYYSHENKICIGVGKEPIWSEELTVNASLSSTRNTMEVTASKSRTTKGKQALKSVTSAASPLVNGTTSKGTFEIVDWQSKKAYQLMVMALDHLPGAFFNTTVLTIIPLYTIVNCIDEALYVRQIGVKTALIAEGHPTASTYAAIPPCRSQPWHKAHVNFSTRLQFRVGENNTMWSLGSIDISEKGVSTMYIPYLASVLDKDKEEKKHAHSGEHKLPYILHVEVKLADVDDANAGVYVIVWKEKICDTTVLSIKNECEFPVTVRQVNAGVLTMYSLEEDACDVEIPPWTWCPFGWIDPAANEKQLMVRVEGHPPTVHAQSDSSVVTASGDARKSRRHAAIVSAENKTSVYLRVADNSGRKGHAGEVVLAMQRTEGSEGRVLRILRPTKDPATNQYCISSNATGLTDNLGSIPTGVPGGITSTSSTGTHHGATEVFMSTLQFTMKIKTIGLSLIVERPVRRELLSFYSGGIGAKLLKRSSDSQKHSTSEDGRKTLVGGRIVDNYSIDMWVDSVQIDNYSESAIYPVLLAAPPPLDKNNNSKKSDIKFLSLNVLKEVIHPHYTHSGKATAVSSVANGHQLRSEFIKSFDLKVSDIMCEVDSASVELIFTDLLETIHYVSSAQSKVLLSPNDWIKKHTYKTHLYCGNSDNVVLSEGLLKKNAELTQSFFHFHRFSMSELKLIISFVQTPFPRKKKRLVREEAAGGSGGVTVVEVEDIASLSTTFVNILKSFASVDRMPLKLTSYGFDNSTESIDAIMGKIMSKCMYDLQMQLPQVAGSLNMIGNPLEFARGISNGFHVFFNEPYQGLSAKSASKFISGVGRGTSGLLGGVVSGTMNSTAAIVDTASRGISYLSGDAAYVRERALERQKLKAARSGIVGAIFEGTENAVGGISAGITGLFTKPVEEATKTGASGFFKGVGLGLLGAAVKPVIGISDGLTSVAQGISNQIVQNNDMAGNAGIALQIRLPRAFKRWDSDLDVKVLVPLNLEAGENQRFVLDRRSMNGGYEDAFVDYVSLGVTTVPTFTPDGQRKDMQYSAGAVVISEKFLFWRRQEAKKLWGRRWSNISHVAVLHADARAESLAKSHSAGTNNNLPCIRVFLYNGEGHVDIVSGNVEAIRAAYASVEKQAFRMGFPDRVMPPSFSTSFTSMTSRGSFGGMEDPAQSETLATRSGSNTNDQSCAIKRRSSLGSDDSDECMHDQEDEYLSRRELAAVALSMSRSSSSSFGSFSNLLGKIGSSPSFALHATGELNGYLFGSINGHVVPESNNARGAASRKTSGESTQINSNTSASVIRSRQSTQYRNVLNGAEHDLCCIDSMKCLDEIAWRLVFEWDLTHTGLQACYCCVTVIINNSVLPVQIHRAQLLQGCNVEIIGNTRFDPEARTLYSSGIAIVFSWAYSPSPINDGNLKLSIATSAFTAVVASVQSEASIRTENGFAVGFLEKTVSQWWSKYCILVTP